MPVAWRWPALIAVLVIIAVLLAWIDSSLFEPVMRPASRHFRGVRAPDGLPPEPPPLRSLTPFGFAFGGGFLTFGWYVATALGLLFAGFALLAIFPARVRLVVDHLDSFAVIPTALVAGFATVLLLAAFSFLLRLTVVLLPLAGLLLAVALLGALFGMACLALRLAGRLRSRLGDWPPLLAGLAGLLVIADLALIPYGGPVLLGLLALIGLGLSVVTRFGSPGGWAMDELDW
jgi:hypothetical protein